jgi:hypothetical protein
MRPELEDSWDGAKRRDSSVYKNYSRLSHLISAFHQLALLDYPSRLSFGFDIYTSRPSIKPFRKESHEPRTFLRRIRETAWQRRWYYQTALTQPLKGGFEGNEGVKCWPSLHGHGRSARTIIVRTAANVWIIHL